MTLGLLARRVTFAGGGGGGVVGVYPGWTFFLKITSTAEHRL